MNIKDYGRAHRTAQPYLPMLSGKQLAKTHRGRRHLADREGKLIENEKKTLFLKGPNVSEIVKQALTDLNCTKKPATVSLTKRNITRPFEDQSSIEFLTKVNDASTFIYGSHSKKRPHSLVFGRTFDFQLLDMLEAQIDPATFKDMDFFAQRQGTARVGSKPMFVFIGEEFETDSDAKLARSLLLDLFHGQFTDKINLISLERVVICTCQNKKILFRQFTALKKKSGSKFPKIELEEMGPRMDLTINRTKVSSDDLQKEAMKTPKQAVKRYAKNISESTMGDKVGRIHVNQQDINTLGLAKTKALGKRKLSTKAFEQEKQEKKMASSSNAHSDMSEFSSNSSGHGRGNKGESQDGSIKVKTKTPMKGGLDDFGGKKKQRRE